MTPVAGSTGRHAYFPHIDGLRTLAVLSVVIYHLDARWLPGGFSGVDIFFVISGFIVSASVGARAKANLPAFAVFFLARRIQRIAPALLACLLLTCLCTALLVPSAWLSEANQKTGHFAFFGLSNVILARTGHDYFSPIADFNPYMHTWSLGVEEQFYLLFPAMFFLWNYAGRRSRGQKSSACAARRWRRCDPSPAACRMCRYGTRFHCCALETHRSAARMPRGGHCFSTAII